MSETTNDGLELTVALPLNIKPVGAERRRRRSTSVLEGPAINANFRPSIPPGDRRDPLAMLSTRIESLESKVETLLALFLRREQQQARKNAVHLDIHPRGIRFHWPALLSVGDTLEVELTLSLYPFSEINGIVEVKSVQALPHDPSEPTPSYLIDTEFVAISEHHIDEIHRFILTSQRERRRAKPVTKN